MNLSLLRADLEEFAEAISREEYLTRAGLKAESRAAVVREQFAVLGSRAAFEEVHDKARGASGAEEARRLRYLAEFLGTTCVEYRALVLSDRLATAEDRRDVLTELAAVGGWVLEDTAGPAAGLRGFLLPSDRAYAAIVAPGFRDGLCLLELHRHLAAPDGHARAAIPDEHPAAWRELEARGWRHTWLAPRMLDGPDVLWRPTWIWGLINSAMG